MRTLKLRIEVLPSINDETGVPWFPVRFKLDGLGDDSFEDIDTRGLDFRSVNSDGHLLIIRPTTRLTVQDWDMHKAFRSLNDALLYTAHTFEALRQAGRECWTHEGVAMEVEMVLPDPPPPPPVRHIRRRA